MADRKEELREIAQLLTSSMSQFGAFLIQSAEEMRKTLELPERTEGGEAAAAEDGTTKKQNRLIGFVLPEREA